MSSACSNEAARPLCSQATVGAAEGRPVVIDIDGPVAYLLAQQLTQLVVLLGHGGHGVLGFQLRVNMHLHLQGVANMKAAWTSSRWVS